LLVGELESGPVVDVAIDEPVLYGRVQVVSLDDGASWNVDVGSREVWVRTDAGSERLSLPPAATWHGSGGSWVHVDEPTQLASIVPLPEHPTPLAVRVTGIRAGDPILVRAGSVWLGSPTVVLARMSAARWILGAASLLCLGAALALMLGVRRTRDVADRLGAGLLLTVLAPFLVTFSAAIRLEDGGPALFVQERVGEGERRFPCFKFRTMHVDADRMLDAAGRPVEDRITRVGRLLRTTSLDELPQLLNIVRGEMSLVGPRPVPPSRADTFTHSQRRRHRVRPGITGLAQVSGRNTLPWSQRAALDNRYIDEWSPWLDLSILWRTIGVVLRRDGVVLDRNPEAVDDLDAARVAK